MKLNKKLLLLIAITIATFILLIWLIGTFVIKKSVTIIPAKNTQTTISAVDKNGLESRVIAKTDHKTTLHLKSGTYSFKFSSTNNVYKESQKNIDIYKSTTVNTPNLGFTDEKLAEILKANSVKINSGLMQPYVQKGYVVTNESVLFDGNWYAARLMPPEWYVPTPIDLIPKIVNDNNTQDVIKIIARKENDQWKTIVGPSVVFNLEDNSSVPEDVIRSANKLGF